MKKCELCDSLAIIYCESDRASLCCDCDSKVHGANFLVEKHSRTLLCHICQSSTPWNGSGPKLGPTVSVCQSCCVNSSSQHRNGGEADDDDDDEDADTDEEDDDDDDSENEDGGGDGIGDGEGEGNGGEEDEDEENQVVPWSSTPPQQPPPPVSNSSTSEECSSSRVGVFNRKQRN